MSRPPPHPRDRLRRDQRAGFTLLEMIVAMVIIAAVMMVVVQAMARVQDTWVTTNAKVREAQDARAGMETLARTLPRATLNAQWTMDSEDDPRSLRRSSDLHFVSGPAADLLPSATYTTGHAIFFQAPNGYAGTDERTSTTSASSKAEYDTLPNVLNAWGYFVQFGEDPARLPGFLTSKKFARSTVPKRYRFRLMEFRQPAHELELFKMSTGVPPASLLSKITSQGEMYKWFSQPITQPSQSDGQRCAVIADNILALVILPLQQAATTGSAATGAVVPDSAVEYLYDSRRDQWDPANASSAQTRHRLPSAVQISLIVLDERDWSKLTDAEAIRAGADLRGQVIGKFTTPAGFAADMGSITGELNRRRLRHRVITTTLQMPGGAGTTEREAE